MDPEFDPSSPICTYLKSAFLAMEPADCLISLARESGGGSITEGVQRFILDHCIQNVVGNGTTQNNKYIKNILKRVIVATESSCDVVLEELYEQFAYYMTSVMENELQKGNNKIYKYISFLFSEGHNEVCLRSMNLVIHLQCSLNMLEGDTGCALWPSSLFLSEFILSYPKMFSNKFCFEVGSGVGLVGITLTYVEASKVVLSDGDMSSLANMKCNLELNQLNEAMSQITCKSSNLVECKYLSWESASESKLQCYQPDIVLGADIIYDPLCVPHLIRVLAILLNPKKSGLNEGKAVDENYDGFTHHGEKRSNNISHDQVKEAPVAYIATVIRNPETLDCFLRLASQAHLSVVDITETRKPLNLLPYMFSYDRSSIRLFTVSFSWN